VLLPVVLHEDHVGTPHVAVHRPQVMAGLALDQIVLVVEVVGAGEEEVVLADEVAFAAVAAGPLDLLVFGVGIHHEIVHLLDLPILPALITEIAHQLRGQVLQGKIGAQQMCPAGVTGAELESGSEGRQIDVVVHPPGGVADRQQGHSPHLVRMVEHQQVLQGAVVFYPGEAAQLACIPVAGRVHEDHGLRFVGVGEQLMALEYPVHDLTAQ